MTICSISPGASSVINLARPSTVATTGDWGLAKFNGNSPLPSKCSRKCSALDMSMPAGGVSTMFWGGAGDVYVAPLLIRSLIFLVPWSSATSFGSKIEKSPGDLMLTPPPAFFIRSTGGDGVNANDDLVSNAAAVAA